MQATTVFTTQNAPRYLGTLCKHFGHKVPVTLDAGSGRIELPFGMCILRADEVGLRLTVTASETPALNKTIEVITSHLDRFAFRENPQLTWDLSEDA
jgi:hypothetical protein